MWLHLLAQAASESGGSDPLSLFLQYGLPGLVIAALIMGWLWAKPAVDNIKQRAERAEAQRDELVKIYEDKVVPALTENISVNREMKPILLDIVRTLEQVKDLQRRGP
jgi:hypothetical protein